jgi:hypothetical protein
MSDGRVDAKAAIGQFFAEFSRSKIASADFPSLYFTTLYRTNQTSSISSYISIVVSSLREITHDT